MQRSARRTGVGYPKDNSEFDTECYREHWRIKFGKHFDSGRKGTDWCDSPRRFLLFGRPQIGKTGVFHHLSCVTLLPFVHTDVGANITLC